MGIKKTRFFSLIIGLMIYTSLSADPILNVQFSDGSSVSIPFDEEPSITYPTYNTISISSANGLKTYEFDNTITFSYEKTSTSIDFLTIKNYMSNGILVIEGLTSGDMVTIYSILGQVLNTLKVNDDGIIAIDTQNIDDNIFIVKTPTSSFKVTK